MSKKTPETKTEKPTAKKQPTELKDEQLDDVQGGYIMGDLEVPNLRGNGTRIR